MLKTALIIISCTCIISCGSGDASAGGEDDNTNAETKTAGMKNKKNDKFGEWETNADGTRFREDYELREQLGGYELVKYARTDGGQYGGSSSTTKFTLCSDGSLSYFHQSLTTVSVDGAGGSNAAKDEDYGTWRAVENEKGVKILVMKSGKSGNTGYAEIKPTGSKVHMVWYNEWQEFLMKKIDC